MAGDSASLGPFNAQVRESVLAYDSQHIAL